MDKALARWLAVREQADTAARSTRLTQAMADRLRGRDPLRIVDLGTGAGSNVRYLVERLPARDQQWLIVDRSALLLAEARTRIAGAGVGRDRRIEIETHELDLNAIDEADIFAGRDLVTASALLDLVSERWLHAVAEQSRAAGAAALFTITYTGRSDCTPADEDDELVIGLFNEHQRRDKGLGGPAAGPRATEAAVRAFTAAGYHVDTERSDWQLGPEDTHMQRELIDGWASAATETDPRAAERIAAWRTRRLQLVAEGRAHAIVGHDDLAAWLR